MREYLLYLSAFILCTALEISEIKCKTVCAQDGDEYGALVDGKCVCGNSRDTDKVIIKLDRKIKGRAVTRPSWLLE